MFWSVSEGVKILATNMVNHPEDWTQGMYQFMHNKERDIAIWTANGTSFIKYRGNECLSFAEKVHLARAIKKSIALKVALSVSRA